MADNHCQRLGRQTGAGVTSASDDTGTRTVGSYDCTFVRKRKKNWHLNRICGTKLKHSLLVEKHLFATARPSHMTSPRNLPSRLPTECEDKNIRRCLMVSLPLHGEIYVVNGDDIVAFNNNLFIFDIRMSIIYTCMGTKYLCIATDWYVCLLDATLKAC
jgi:hypothetical protein